MFKATSNFPVLAAWCVFIRNVVDVLQFTSLVEPEANFEGSKLLFEIFVYQFWLMTYFSLESDVLFPLYVNTIPFFHRI